MILMMTMMIKIIIILRRTSNLTPPGIAISKVLKNR